MATLTKAVILLLAGIIGCQCGEVVKCAKDLCEFKEKCQLIDVDFSVMTDNEVTVIGVTMQKKGEKRSSMGDDKLKTVFFGTDALDNAEFTAIENDDGTFTGMYALGQTTNNGDFEIMYKSDDIGYVMGINDTYTGDANGDKEMEESVKKMKQALETAVQNRAMMTNAEYTRLKALGESDQDSEVEVSLTIYVTKAARKVFSNKAGFETYISDLMNDAAAGFANSGTKVKLVLKCLKEIPVTEQQSHGYMLEYITGLTETPFNGGFPKNLNGANAAMLLTAGLRNTGCGQAWVGVPSMPYLVCDVYCAIEQRSFAHELGHTFGADHNRENTQFQKGDGFGYWLPAYGNAWRTLMGYSGPRGTYRNRMNYFSNPDTVFYENGKAVPNGLRGSVDNSHFIRSMRYVINGINKGSNDRCQWRG